MAGRDCHDRLLYRFLDRRTNPRDILDQLGGNAVTLL